MFRYNRRRTLLTLFIRACRRLSRKTLIDVLTFALGLFVGLMFAYNHNMTTSLHNEIRTRTNVELALNVTSGNRSAGVKVLCWIMTGTANHWTRAFNVRETWGKRCDKLLFMSSTYDPNLPTIALKNVTEGRDYLWAKTKGAFKYVYDHYRDEFDWFLKADDDSFIVMDRLKNLLKRFDTHKPIHVGRYSIKPRKGFTYMAGGPGYALNKRALTILVESGLFPGPYYKKCDEHHDGNEDQLIGKCLEGLGVKAQQSWDRFGRTRFFYYPLIYNILEYNTEFEHNKSHPYRYRYPECCSDRPIGFHYVHPWQLYVYDYLLNFGDSGLGKE